MFKSPVTEHDHADEAVTNQVRDHQEGECCGNPYLCSLRIFVERHLSCWFSAELAEIKSSALSCLVFICLTISKLISKQRS